MISARHASVDDQMTMALFSFPGFRGSRVPLYNALLRRPAVSEPKGRCDRPGEAPGASVSDDRDSRSRRLSRGAGAPEFEAKQVILAERMNRKPLDAYHLRVVVPLDNRGGRSVRRSPRPLFPNRPIE